MYRLMVDREDVRNKKLAFILLKNGMQGLRLGWKEDLGLKEQRPVLMLEHRTLPLTEILPFSGDLYWEDTDDWDQFVLTDKALFIQDKVFPRGSGVSPVSKQILDQLQVYLTGAGLRVIAYGDPVDSFTRKYHPVARSQKPNRSLNGLLILGQVDLETGEIWPMPEELVA